MWLNSLLFMSAPLVLGVQELKADTAFVRDGSVVEDTFVDGSARRVEFLATSGQTMKLPIGEVISVTFSLSSVAPPSASAGPVARHGVMIKAGVGFLGGPTASGRYAGSPGSQSES